MFLCFLTFLKFLKSRNKLTYDSTLIDVSYIDFSVIYIDFFLGVEIAERNIQCIDCSTRWMKNNNCISYNGTLDSLTCSLSQQQNNEKINEFNVQNEAYYSFKKREVSFGMKIILYSDI